MASEVWWLQRCGDLRGVVACGTHRNRKLLLDGTISTEEGRAGFRSLYRRRDPGPKKMGQELFQEEASAWSETGSDGAGWEVGFRRGQFASPGRGWGGKVRKTAMPVRRGAGCVGQDVALTLGGEGVTEGSTWVNCMV